MIQILYEADHKKRAETLVEVHTDKRYALAGICTNAECALVDSDAKVVKGLDKLDTLVFFGHSARLDKKGKGSPTLCNKNPKEIEKIVKNWKLLNPTLKTVEILTCDGRHAVKGLEALATLIKNALHSSVFSSTRKIVVKALPAGVGGKSGTFSILLADWETKSWCYICAPTFPQMWDIKHTIEVIALTKFPDSEGRPGSGDVAQAANKLINKFAVTDVKDILKEHAKKDEKSLNWVKEKGTGIVNLVGQGQRQYSLNYGYFNTLRSQLVVVKSASFSVASRLNTSHLTLLDKYIEEELKWQENERHL